MTHLDDAQLNSLETVARNIRRTVVTMLAEAGSGHTAGPLGLADIMALLYFHVLRHDPKNPDWPDRDRLVLSNGHVAPVLYAAMAHAGYFPVHEAEATLRRFGSRLQGHPHREWLAGLETSSGPLGSGLSQAVGMAIGDRMERGRRSNRFIYAIMSDGEMEAGQTWEAALLGAKEKLHNVIGIVDRNNIQIGGFTEDVMPLESLRAKWESFNWHVREVDGHNIREVNDAIREAKAVFEKPSVIIAHTIPGKGVSYAERDPAWHGTVPGKGPENITPKDRQVREALNELE